MRRVLRPAGLRPAGPGVAAGRLPDVVDQRHRRPEHRSTGKATTAPSTVLYGDSTVNGGGRSGFRTTFGMWLDNCNVWGVEFDYLNLGRGNQRLQRQQPPITAYPLRVRFYNIHDRPTKPAELVVFPGYSSPISVVRQSDRLLPIGRRLRRPTTSARAIPCERRAVRATSRLQQLCVTSSVPTMNCRRTDLPGRLPVLPELTTPAITEDLNETDLNADYLIHDDFHAPQRLLRCRLGPAQPRSIAVVGRWNS